MTSVGVFTCDKSGRTSEFEKLGGGILRRAWFNLDPIWSAALVPTGMLTLML